MLARLEGGEARQGNYIGGMQLEELVLTSRQVSEVAARGEKIARLAALLARLSQDEVDTATAFLSGATRQGRIGIGPALIRAAQPANPAPAATLGLLEVDAAFARIAAVSGAGSTAERTQLLHALLARGTAAEVDFLSRLLFGELRQGALEGVLLEAVARAARVPTELLRRAAMTAGGLGTAARAALAGGEAGLAGFLIQLFQPVQPMLAEPASGLEEALGDLGEAALERKLDGARIQVHKGDGEVRVFSRALREVTAAVPEVVEAVQQLPARSLILDGEVLALRPDQSPQPFQVTMRRFGRKLDVAALRAELPLQPFFFDCLYRDGVDWTAAAQAERFGQLLQVVPAPFIIPHLRTARLEEAQAFLAQALAAGHEGVMAKAPGAPYITGGRGRAWLKIKAVHTLDLVVLAAEWGSGRREGTLSNLHLGARDPGSGGFVMLGKTFKGLTDAMLAWQTQRLLSLEVRRDRHIVYVKPELVVEVAFNEVQVSPHYPGGLALRFARVRRYREDKPASEADTLAAVQELYHRSTPQASASAPRSGSRLPTR